MKWSSVRQVCYDSWAGALAGESSAHVYTPRRRDNDRAARRSSLPARAPGKVRRAALPEASGIAKSRRHPGIFWVHNDSGNPPVLFAIRRDGTIVREFRLGVPNIDWEDIAADDQGHLYVGDIGNNGGLLPVRAVYRFDEPDPGKPAGEPLRPSVSAFYGFSRANRFDAEGLVFEASTGSAVLVAKRLDGREAELFAIPLSPPAPLLRPASPRASGPYQDSSNRRLEPPCRTIASSWRSARRR